MSQHIDMKWKNQRVLLKLRLQFAARECDKFEHAKSAKENTKSNLTRSRPNVPERKVNLMNDSLYVRTAGPISIHLPKDIPVFACGARGPHCPDSFFPYSFFAVESEVLSFSSDTRKQAFGFVYPGLSFDAFVIYVIKMKSLPGIFSFPVHL